MSSYKQVIVPALYAASDVEIRRVNEYAKSGGHVFYTLKNGFTDENVKVRPTDQPGVLTQSAGVTYNKFTLPEGVSLAGDPYHVGSKANVARWWMELLTPTTATVLARYEHPTWGRYAALTRNQYGMGEATYLGFMPSDDLIEALMREAVTRAGLSTPAQKARFPMIIRSGRPNEGHDVHYLLNYSPETTHVPYGFRSGRNLLDGSRILTDAEVPLGPWGFAVIEEDVSEP